jgi:uncharacterized membrane protein
VSNAPEKIDHADVVSVGTDRRFWFAVGVIVLFGLAARLPTLTRSLWLDEAYSVWFSLRSLHELWNVVPTYEGHPPLYYTILKGWTALVGTSEVALRAPSMLASLLTIGLVATSGRILKAGTIGDKVGLLSALLLAFNSGNIMYAQEARPYALETLTASFAVLGALMIVRSLLESRDTRADFRGLVPGMITLAIGAGATLWLHNTALFIAFGIWVGLALSLFFLPGGNRWRQLLAIVVPGVGAVLIWSPFIPTYIRQVSGFSGTPFWIVFSKNDLLTAWYLIAGNAPSLIFIAFFGLVGMVILWRKARPMAVLLATILLLPWASVLLVSYLSKPIFVARIFEWMAPSVMTLTAFGIMAGLRQRSARLIASVAVVFFSAISTYASYASPTEDWRGVIKLIAEQSQPGDLVIGNSSEVYLPFAYYAPGEAKLPDLLFVPGPFPMIDPTHHRFTATPLVTREDLPAVQRALATHKRVWLVETTSFRFDPDAIVADEILISRKPQQAFERGGIHVTLFQ